ncbi:asparagine synthase (glutamine-hydrolysing) [Amycolatopsis echigonensis]|uniref:asparagine synthase (glutamine-hydrolyzing) n=1 Tax=Amycolatopsis echigonensis TaxID=2576905 RepID=A0A2N3WJA4_9PSEU|nr:asparagine synthase (glutamine-hydrolyzing) [Amycolatopsis niigatensis]PKV93954.1 asparagine synthase (glutamine-hydrolysing) [Amycolatopsis niigatensis]
MCGITGWVDFERDLSTEVRVLRAMNETLHARGPDETGEWVDREVALGHKRLSVLDPEHGNQPMIAGTDAVVTFGGEIYNHRELRAELAGKGHRFETSTDTEVLLRSYLEWGADCVTRFNGMFAFAIWDRRTHELVLARDPIGVKPLFYFPTPTGVLFASEPKALLTHRMVEPVVGMDGLRELLAHGRKPGAPIFRGMPEVKPGHTVVVSRQGLAERQYWSLTAQEHSTPLDTTIAEIRELLDDIVRRQLIADVPTSVLLSGGIDSSALTGLAAAALREPIHTYSMSFHDYEEKFTPQKLRETPDPPFVADVVRFVGTNHTDFVATSQELADPVLRRAVLLSQDIPTHHGDMDTSLYTCFRSLRERGKLVTLSGEGADEVFGGYFWSYDEKLTRAGTFPWVAFERGKAATGGLGLGLLDEGVRKELDLYGYADQHYRDALQEVPVLDGERDAARRARQVNYLVLTRWLPTLLDREDRLSMANGVELRVPYCDHRLAQYLFDAPPEMKRGPDGQEKYLLRRAVADLLPESVLTRKKSAYPTTQDPDYGRIVRAHFRDLVADPLAPVTPLLDLVASKELLRGESPDEQAAAWVDRARMEMVLQLDSWLREYQVRLED